MDVTYESSLPSLFAPSLSFLPLSPEGGKITPQLACKSKRPTDDLATRKVDSFHRGPSVLPVDRSFPRVCLAWDIIFYYCNGRDRDSGRLLPRIPKENIYSFTTESNAKMGIKVN